MVFCPNCKVATRMILVLRMQPFALDNWRQLPKVGRQVGKNWCTYVWPLGVDPYLQHAPFQAQVRCLTGFAARTQTGYFRRGQKVQSSTVSGAITAIG
jgi:hypothetical protein